MSVPGGGESWVVEGGRGRGGIKKSFQRGGSLPPLEARHGLKEAADSLGASAGGPKSGRTGKPRVAERGELSRTTLRHYTAGRRGVSIARWEGNRILTLDVSVY